MKELNEILKSAIKGSPEAFEELCAVKGQSIIYWCVKMMGNVPDGEDAAQEVFIRLQKEIVNLKNPNAFNSWSYLLVQSTCNNLRRKSMKNIADFPIEEYEDVSFAEGYQLYLPQDVVENEEKRQLFLGVINEMPTNMKMCLILFYYDGFTRDEIATALDIPPNTVKVLLYRGRLKLKKEISVLEPELENTSTVPMVLLQEVFATDAATISSSLVGQCTASAVAAAYASVIAGGAIAGTAVAGTAAASTAIGTTLTAIVSVLVAGACLTATIVSAGNSSTSNSAFSSTSNVAPQRTEQVEQSMKEDIVSQEAVFVVSDPQSAQSDSDPSGKSQSSSVPGNSESKNENENKNEDIKLEYTIKGNAFLVNSEQKLLEGNEKFPVSMQVILQKDGQVIAQAKTDENGAYSFQKVLLEKGNYAVKFSFLPSRLIEFGTPYENGKVEFSVGDSKEVDIPDIFVIDSVAPTLAVTFYDAKNKMNRTNPKEVVVDVSDLTKTDYVMYIYLKNTNEKIVEGDMQAVNGFLQGTPAKGTYVLKVIATDVAQNKASAEFDFYIV